MFRYARPRTVSEALGLLGDGARAFSGGTDVFVGVRRGKLAPDVLVDLKAVPELAPRIEQVGESVEISANTPITDIVQNLRIRELFPALVEAAVEVGSIQIRNRATLVGNICNASPAADTAPPLLLYGAEVEVLGAEGMRRVPLDEFFVGPGTTALKAGELVTGLGIPVPVGLVGSAFKRLTRRRGVDLATVSVCCGVHDDGRVRFAVGAAGPRPFIVSDPSGTLADRTLPDAGRRTAIERVMRAASPISDVRATREYRAAMLVVLGERALAAAMEQAGPIR